MNDDMVTAVARLDARRTKDRISVDERALDRLLWTLHQHAFADGWDAGKRFVVGDQGRRQDAVER